MEPFELTLNQVNFEEKDIAPDQILYSFSNIVSYDSDFKEEEHEGVPILPKRFQFNKKEESQDLVARSRSALVELSQIGGGDPGKQERKRHLSGRKRTRTESGGEAVALGETVGAGSATVDAKGDAFPEEEMAGHSQPKQMEDMAASVTDMVKIFQSPTEDDKTGKIPYKDPLNRSMSFEPSTDSFKAFTETVEALALQKSVIGNPSITPASEDEVARVVAMARQKLISQPTSDQVGTENPVQTGLTQEDTENPLILYSMTRAGAVSSTVDGATAVNGSHDMRSNAATYGFDSEAEASNTELASTAMSSVESFQETMQDTTTAASAIISQSISQSPQQVHTYQQHTKVKLKVDRRSFSSSISDSSDHSTPQQEKSGSRSASRSSSVTDSLPSPSPEGSQKSRKRSPKPTELVRIHGNQVTRVTERGASSGIVPSERIRPAHLPRCAISLVMPPEKCDEPVLPDVLAGSVANQNGAVENETFQKHKVEQNTVIHKREQINLRETNLVHVVEENDINVRESESSRQEIAACVDVLDNRNLYSVEGDQNILKNERPLESTPPQECVPSANISAVDKNQNQTDASTREHKVTEKDRLVRDFMLKGGDEAKGSSDAASDNSQTSPELDTLLVATQKALKSNVGQKPKSGHTKVETVVSLSEDSSKKDIVEVKSKVKVHNADLILPQVPIDTSTPLKSAAVHMEKKAKKKGNKKNKKSGKDQFEGRNAGSVGEQKIADDDDYSVVSQNGLEASRGRVYNLAASLNTSTDYLQNQLDQVLREKVKLEGQLEVVEKEARTAMKERAELQGQLAATQSQMKSQQSSAYNAVGDRDALSVDLNLLKQNKTRLEAVIIDAQKLIEEKDADMRTLHEEMVVLQEANEKLQEQLTEVKGHIQGKETTVQALKGKVAELYVEFQTTNQVKILAENEVKSLQSEVKSLTNAKEWYQDQLRQVQDSKANLQATITNIQAENITQATLIERLKAENVRVKHQVSDAQQRALQEKSLLARHLEAIEADMMEREAAYATLQQQRENIEQFMNSEEQRIQHDQEAAAVSELQDELKRANNDLRRKQAAVAVLEHEQTELVKRLTLSQESILQRDKTIETMGQKYIDVEVLSQKLQRDLHSQGEEMSHLQQLKDALEIELSTAREEKKEFDLALQAIKSDMGKVEGNFKQMAGELAIKKDELERMSWDKGQMSKQLKELEAVLVQERTATKLAQTTSQQLQEESVQHSSDNETILRDNEKIIQELETRHSQLEDELKEMKAQFQNTSQELLSVQKDKEELEDQFVKMRDSTAEMKTNIEILIEENGKLKGSLSASKIDEDAIDKLSQENSDLRQQVVSYQQDSNQQVAKYQAKASKSTEEFERLQQQIQEKETVYVEKLTQLTNDIAAMEEQRKEAEDRVSILEKSSQEKEDLLKRAESEIKLLQEKNELLCESQKDGINQVNALKIANRVAQEAQKQAEDKLRASEEGNKAAIEEKLQHETIQVVEEVKQKSQPDSTSELDEKTKESLRAKLEEELRDSITKEIKLKYELDVVKVEKEMRDLLEAHAAKRQKEAEKGLADMKKRAEAAEMSNVKLQNQLHSLHKGDASVDEVRDSLQKETIERNKELEKQFNDINQKYKEAEELVIKLKEDIEERDITVEMRTLEKEEMKLSLQAEKEEMRNELTEKLKEAEDKVATADKVVNELKLELENSMQRGGKENDERLADIVQQLAMAQEAKLKLEEEMQEKMTNLMAETEQSLTESVHKVKAAEETRSQLEAQLRAVVAQHEQNQQVVLMYQQKMEQLALTLSDTEKHRQELQNKLEQMQLADTSLLEQQSNEYEETIQKLHDQLVLVEEDRKRLEDQLKVVLAQDTEAKVKVYEETLQNFSMRLQVAEEEKLAIKSEMEMLRSEKLEKTAAEDTLLVNDLRTKIEKVEEENTRVNSRLQDLLQTESAESDVSGYKNSITEILQKLEISSEVKYILETEMHVILHRQKQEKNAALEEKLTTTHEKLTSAEEANHQLQEEIAGMRREVEKVPEPAPETGKQLQILEEEVSLLSEEKLALEAALQEAQTGLRQRAEDVQQLSMLRQEYQEVMKVKVTVEEELDILRTHYQQAIEIKNRTEDQLHTSTAAVAEQRHHVAEMEQRVLGLEEELRQSQEALAQKMALEEQQRKLVLDLEREKGRLAGVVQSHNALKDHTISLEAALAQREGSTVELTSNVHEKLIAKDRDITELKAKVKDMEESSAKEKQNVKDVKKQLMKEKGAHIKLRREMEALWVDKDQMLVDIASKSQEVKTLTLQLEKVRDSEMAAKMELEKLKTEGQSSKLELERMERELRDRQAKDPLTMEQMRTLEWQLSQKMTELDAMKEQCHLVEERQNMEIENLQKTVQANSHELSVLRDELAMVKQERTALQARVAELKTALESNMNQAKMLKARRKQNKAAVEKELETKTSLLPFDMEGLERLLQDTKPVTVTSKPLSFLKATLTGLRGEITTLQDQVHQHTETVQTSSLAWKDLEEQVKDLRALVKSSAASRAAQEDTGSLENQLTPPSGQTGQQATNVIPTNASDSQVANDSKVKNV